MQIIIKNLFGKKNFDIDFNNHINVLIGENGSGKSTILKMLNYIAHRDFISLSKYYFDEIIIRDNEKEDRIERNDLLQLSFSKNLQFSSKFYQFTNEYLKKLNLPGEFSFDEEFSNYYSSLLKKFGPQYTYLDSDLSIDSEQYFKDYTYKDIYFLLNRDYEEVYDDWRFEQDIQSYLMTFFDSNKVIYGSKIYFKIIFLFMLSYIIAKEESITRYDSKKSLSWTYLNFSLFQTNFGNPRIDNSTVPGWRIDFGEEVDNKYHVFCDQTAILLKNTKYYDYVVFEEETKTTSTQIKNIRFFEEDTLFLELDEMLNKINKINETSKKEECLSFFEIDEICDVNVIERVIKLINYEIKNLFTFRFKYLFDDKYTVMKEAFDYIVNNKGQEPFVYTKGYSFIELFKYLQNNSERIMTNINNKDLLLFKELSSKYITNKTIDFDVMKLLSGNNPLTIYDKMTRKEIQYSFLSSGEKKIIRLLFMMCFDKKEYKVLLLDEPELSLSPYWQEMLLNDLNEYCKTTLIIIATQSPNLINEDQLEWLIEVKKEG